LSILIPEKNLAIGFNFVQVLAISPLELLGRTSSWENGGRFGASVDFPLGQLRNIKLAAQLDKEGRFNGSV